MEGVVAGGEPVAVSGMAGSRLAGEMRPNLVQPIIPTLDITFPEPGSRLTLYFVHGHSSHHVKGIEVYKDRLILYGAGDFINDYEGIAGYEEFRGDLVLMHFASVDPATGKLARLQMTPMQIKQFRLSRASRADALWLRDVLNREGQALGTSVEMDQNNVLTLRWD